MAASIGHRKESPWEDGIPSRCQFYTNNLPIGGNCSLLEIEATWLAVSRSTFLFSHFSWSLSQRLYIVRKHVIVRQEMQSLILLAFCQITTCVRDLGEMIRFIWGTPVSYTPEKMSFVGHVLLKLSCWMNFFCSDRWWYTWVFDFDESVTFPAGLRHCRCQKIRWMNHSVCTVPIQLQYHSHGCGTRAHSCLVGSIETIGLLLC